MLFVNGEFVIVPGAEVPWDDFVLNHPAGSIALDGYVPGKSDFEPVGPYATLDHHKDVGRFSTASTAQQLLICLRNGLRQSFHDEHGNFTATAFANHADEDIFVAKYLLDHADELSGPVTTDQLPLEHFVHVAGVMDATAGAYPYPVDFDDMQIMAWIFEEYNVARLEKLFYLPENKHSAALHYELTAIATGKIALHLAGRGERRELDTRHNKTIGGEGWHIVEKIGAHARIGAFADGVDAYLMSEPSAENDGRWHHVVGRRSPFVPFPVPELTAHMNTLEPGWGGATNVAGSPRPDGSIFDPVAVQHEFNSVIAAKR